MRHIGGLNAASAKISAAYGRETIAKTRFSEAFGRVWAASFSAWVAYAEIKTKKKEISRGVSAFFSYFCTLER